jgi:hypothetical protein
VTATPPAPKRRPPARELLTATAERILATRYPGQVRAVVIERALQRMAATDARRQRTAARRSST